MNIDILIVIGYFVFLLGVGWMFRSATSSTSDYFRGGGKMLWWMVGSTAFLQALSAMTFTGVMGKALDVGLSISVIFFANALGYFCNYLFFAARARQMRVISPIQGIRKRFGPVSEQVVTWATVPSSVLQAALWLNALAIFASAVFNIPIETTIVAAGMVVLLMSLVGGSWAVVASDFIQMIIITVVTFIATIVAIYKSGGVTPILEAGLPDQGFVGEGYSYTYLFVGWFICIFIKQFFSTNNMIDSYRYIAAKDTNNARKAAILACCLMAFGPFIWFLPAWYVSGNYPDMSTWGLDVLGKDISNATYFVFVRNEMPVGMVGLMMSAMFAATMSSMDSALNRNAGIFIKNVYEPYMAKDKSDKSILFASKVSTVVFGLLIIVCGLFMSKLQDFGLFDALMMVSTLVAFPVLIPSLLCFFIKKTPDWSCWATIAVGACVSAVIASTNAPMIESLFNLSEPLSSREFAEMKSITMGVTGHIIITGGFFLLTQLFYKEPTGKRAEEIAEFFSNAETPVIVEDSPQSFEADRQQYILLGRVLLATSAALLLLTLIPNPMWGRMLFVLMAAIVGFISWLLLRAGKLNDVKLKAYTV
ncbi:transporter [Vibrio cyclitrophicus]|uniref:Transporter n=3 Tax=Vibrio TaxID=662 RepID=A0A7Z1S466_9VIBR|nr:MULTISPECIES: transporter [Vibrio]OED71415.1 transporter [Vibrio splendidus ZS-139]MCC4774138.1 transporter [Vibrio cyclitrophicus]MCC4840694.1 transporter [Vibrio cyclitrophicus]MCC5518834.1 transporter [Vibrio splendidus]MDH6016580.1 transporter [Vibrio splendidus]